MITKMKRGQNRNRNNTDSGGKGSSYFGFESGGRQVSPIKGDLLANQFGSVDKAIFTKFCAAIIVKAESLGKAPACRALGQ